MSEAKPYSAYKTFSLKQVKIIGSGSYVPGEAVSNAALEARNGFDAAWIQQRSGIESRHYVAKGEATSELSVEAANRAIAASGIDKSEIDLIVVGTCTADYLLPGTANLVQQALGIPCAAFDLNAACASFVYALTTASQFLKASQLRNALVIGADCLTRIVPPDNPKLTPLFGDAAGAVVITHGDDEQGHHCYQLGSDGSGLDMLKRETGGSRFPMDQAALESGSHFLAMDGRGVYKWAVKTLAESVTQVLQQADVPLESVSQFFFHQANKRIIESAAEQIGIPAEKLAIGIDRYGNTSSASIPLCLDDALRLHQIKPGDFVVMSGFGAGLSWGTSLFRW